MGVEDDPLQEGATEPLASRDVKSESERYRDLMAFPGEIVECTNEDDGLAATITEYSALKEHSQPELSSLNEAERHSLVSAKAEIHQCLISSAEYDPTRPLSREIPVPVSHDKPPVGSETLKRKQRLEAARGLSEARIPGTETQLAPIHNSMPDLTAQIMTGSVAAAKQRESHIGLWSDHRSAKKKRETE